MDLIHAEKISKALGDRSRLRILEEVRGSGEYVYASQIYKVVHLAQPSISHHLKQLVDAGLVVAQKEGRQVKYILNVAVFREYIDYLEGLTIAVHEENAHEKA